MDRAFALSTSLLGRSDVSGVLRSSLRFKGGKWSPEECISVGVRKKRPLAELGPGEAIPSEIAGVKTDIIELNPKLSLYSPRYSVMCGGVSIGNTEDESSGTLGGFFYDTITERICGLTNFHVLAQGDTPKVPSTYVIHPSLEDGGDASWRVAKSTRFLLSEWGDAAIFTPYKDPGLSVLESHQILRNVVEPEIDDLVEKVGRTTGVTQGIVSAIGYLTLDYTDYGYDSILMSVMAYIPRDDPDELIVDGGDSGSIVYNSETGEALGLHVAHVTDPVIGYACVLAYVLEELECAPLSTQVYELQDIGTTSLSEQQELEVTGTVSFVPADTSFTAKMFAIDDWELEFTDFETWVQYLGFEDTAAFLSYWDFETVEDFVTANPIPYGEEEAFYTTVEQFLADQKVKSLKNIMADVGVTF